MTTLTGPEYLAAYPPPQMTPARWLLDLHRADSCGRCPEYWDGRDHPDGTRYVCSMVTGDAGLCEAVAYLPDGTAEVAVTPYRTRWSDPRRAIRLFGATHVVTGTWTRRHDDGCGDHIDVVVDPDTGRRKEV